MLREDALLRRLTLALSAVSLLPIVFTPILPLVDMGSHVGAAGLLDDLIGGAPVVSERYAINASLIPYWVGYVFFAAVDVILGPFAAAKVTVATVVVLLPLSTMRLMVALGRSPRLGLWAFLLAWDMNLYWGWFTFQLGMALALWALAWMLEATTVKEVLRATVLTAIVALTHLHAVALLGVAGIVLAPLRPRPMRSMLLHAVALMGFVALLPWVATRLFRGGKPGALSFDFEALQDRVSHFWGYSLNTFPGGEAWTAVAFLVLLFGPLAIAAVDAKPAAPRSNALALGMLGSCLALYLVLPFSISGAVNHFWTFPRYASYVLLTLLIIPTVGLEGRRAWLLSPGIAMVVALTWLRVQQFSAYGDRVRPYVDVVAAMKPGSKFLPLDIEIHWPGAGQPTLGQLHGYAAAARASYDPHLFDHDNSPIVFKPEGRPPEPNWFDVAGSFSMAAQGRHYDYIIVHPKGRDPLAGSGDVELVKESGEWRLYAVKQPVARAQ